MSLYQASLKARIKELQEINQKLVEVLNKLIEAIRKDADEEGHGISGYTATRVHDAKVALRLVGEK